MSMIAAADDQTFARIAELRAIAKDARKKVTDLRSVIKAEHAMRERVEAYIRYWRVIQPNWSFDELWSDVMRLRPGSGTVGGTWEELDTDEEDQYVDEPLYVPSFSLFQYSNTPLTSRPEGAIATLKHGAAKHPPKTTGQSFVPFISPLISVSLYVKSRVTVLLQPVAAPTASRPSEPLQPVNGPASTNASRKRSREDNEDDADDDADRCRSRPRFGSPSKAGATVFHPNRPDAPSLKAKGKRRMTNSEVDAMHREESRRLAQEMPVVPPEPPLGLTLTEEEIEQDTVVSLLAEAGHQRDPVVPARQPPTPDKKPVPKARRSRRRVVSQPPAPLRRGSRLRK